MQIGCALCGASVQTEHYTVLCPVCVGNERKRTRHLDRFLEMYVSASKTLRAAREYAETYPDEAGYARLLITYLTRELAMLAYRYEHLIAQDREITARIDAAHRRAS